MRNTLVVLLAVLALVNAQAKIIMTPTSGTIDKASKITISLKLTEPILCNDPHAYCGVTVLFTNANPKQITLSACHVEWVRDAWTETKTVTIQAVENFVDDGQKSFSLITEPAQSESEFYNLYDLPDIALTTKSRPAGQCSSLTDPHIFQFDGGNFIDLTAGTFLLWSAPMRDFEVHTRVTNGRNCGVAMRDRCDLVIMDRCSGSPIVRTDFKTVTDKNHPVVTRLSGGSTYIVDFPRSGASIKVNFVSREFQVGRQSCGWSGCTIVYDSHTEYWIDVFATAPGADWGYQADHTTPRTRGLCGSFDSVRSNDPAIKDVSKFAIPTGQSWFEKPVSCTPIIPEIVDYSRCTYVPPKVQRPVISYPDSEVVTDLLKSIVLRNDDPRVTYQFEANASPIPTFTAADEARVEAFCTKAISESPAALACQAIGVDLQKFIASCQLDILYQGDETLVDGSVQAMKESCHFIASTNISLFDIASDGSLVVSNEQIQLGSLLTCPNDCSFHGTCTNGKCTCETGFTGADCFTSTADLPSLNRLIPAVHDSRSPQATPTYISLISDNFVPNAVKCKIDGIPSELSFVSVNEVLCYFPANYTNNGAIEKVVNVTFSNDGVKWSLPLVFTFFDSGCRQCTELGVCSDKSDSCKIGGQCYAADEASPTNACLTCQPATTTTKFGYSYANSAACGPVFNLPNYVASIPEDQRINTPIVVVNAKNALVSGDSRNSYTYSVVSPALFTVGSANGALSVTGPLDFETTSQYTVVVQATDAAGNKATVNVFVTVLDVNEFPVFPQSAYSFTLNENVATATLGTFKATDPDTNSTGLSWNKITYALNSFQFISFTSAFSIDPVSGVLTTVAPLDFEKRSTYVFNVTATDGGKLVGSTTVTLNLVDLNEAPTFIGLMTNQIDENAVENTVVGNLYTDDPDNDQTFSYVLLDNAGGRFKLATAAGVTTLVAGAVATNYEVKNSYTLEVVSTDSGSPAYSLTMSFAIIINDVNDAPTDVGLFTYPTWEDAHDSTSTTASTTSSSGRVVSTVPFVSLSEATKPGVVATFTTTDEDLGQTYTYTLKSNPGNYFQISDDRLVLVNPISYQTVKSVILTVVSTDSGFPALTTSVKSFNITILDANQPPAFGAFTSAVAVSELASIGTAVGTVTAIEDPNRDFVFTITDTNSKFVVGATTCAQTAEGTRCQAPITLNAALDYETTKVETLVITGTCTNNSLSAVFNLPVPVVDMNEAPTAATLTSSTIVEGSASGTVVGSIVVSDPDNGDSNTVQLINNAGGRFTLRTSTANGVSVTDLVVANGFSIDFESLSQLSVSVKATDKGGLSSTFTVPITVLDEPVVVRVATPTINERTAVDTVVSSVSITGLDRNDQTARLTLTNNANGAFKLSDSTLTPKLLVADSTRLNAAVATKLTLTFTVSFTSTTTTPLPSTTTTVDIAVTNVNEAPVLTLQTARTITEIPDDSAVGTVIFTASAVDPDANDVVTLSITGGNSLGLLALDPTTGQVTLTVVPNRSTVTMNGSPVSVVVTATDAAGAAVSSSVLVRFVDGCVGSPCQNDGVCIDRVNDYLCSCMPDSDGRNCENLNTLEIDLAGAQASSAGSSVSTGAGVGIAFGVIVALALIAFLAIFVIRNQSKPRHVAPNSITSVLYDEVDRPVNPPQAQKPSEYSDFAPFAVTDVFVAGASNPLYSWYQPATPKDSCLENLAFADTGSFIIRDFTPTPGWHMLVVKTQTEVVSEKIRLTADGTYQLAGETFRPRGRLPSFATIPELVQHYASPDQKDLPVTLSVDNPIYDNSKLLVKGKHRQVEDSQEARPSLPLRGHEALVVSSIANDSSNESDLYLNQVEARNAINQRHGSVSLSRPTGDSAI